jgi:hypothetical protein
MTSTLGGLGSNDRCLSSGLYYRALRFPLFSRQNNPLRTELPMIPVELAELTDHGLMVLNPKTPKGRVLLKYPIDPCT